MTTISLELSDDGDCFIVSTDPDGNDSRRNLGHVAGASYRVPPGMLGECERLAAEWEEVATYSDACRETAEDAWRGSRGNFRR